MGEVQRCTRGGRSLISFCKFGQFVHLFHASGRSRALKFNVLFTYRLDADADFRLGPGDASYGFPPVLQAPPRDHKEYSPGNAGYVPSNDRYSADDYFFPSNKYSHSDTPSYSSLKYSAEERYPSNEKYPQRSHSFFPGTDTYESVSRTSDSRKHSSRHQSHQKSEFANIFSNILDTKQDKIARAEKAAFLKSLQEAQKKFSHFPVRKSWERRKDARSRDVISHHGYGYRKRREATQATPTDADYDVIDVEPTSEAESKAPSADVSNEKSDSKSHHTNLKDMTMGELQKTLQHSVQTVARILESEERKTQRKNEKASVQRLTARNTSPHDATTAKSAILPRDSATVPKDKDNGQQVAGDNSVTSNMLGFHSNDNTERTLEGSDSDGHTAVDKGGQECVSESVTEDSEHVSASDTGEGPRSKARSPPKVPVTTQNMKHEEERGPGGAQNVRKRTKRRTTSAEAAETRYLRERLKSSAPRRRRKRREGGARQNEAGRRRRRRHVGPHDEGGVQRLISTGTVHLFQ